MDSKLLDKRVVKRNIAKGAVTKAQYKKYLNGLKDLTGECEPLDISLDGDEEDTNDEEEQPEEEAGEDVES